MTGNINTFKNLGFTGTDIRHIAVRVYPYAEVLNGKLVKAHRVYTGEGSGDFHAGNETNFIFASMDEGWVFHEFEMDGITWEGISIYPKDGDFTVAFSDQSRRAVILNDACNKLYSHRYQIVMRNVATGELATNDPVVDNGDQEHT